MSVSVFLQPWPFKREKETYRRMKEEKNYRAIGESGKSYTSLMSNQFMSEHRSGGLKPFYTRDTNEIYQKCTNNVLPALIECIKRQPLLFLS